MISLFFNSKGNKIKIGPEFGRGAEGAIYPVLKNPNLCVKIYTDKLQRDTDRFEKIKYMVNNPPSNIVTPKGKVQIAWPNDILYQDNKGCSFAGIIMPLIDVTSYNPAHYYYCPTDREENQVLVNWEHALITSRNIATVLDSLHEKGYCVGDLQSNNILVNLIANVAFIDCDSFQVTDKKNNKIYYNTVGLPEYTPPELIGKNLKDGFERKYSDLFAIGTIIFQFLMQNALPYQAVGLGVAGAPSPTEKIALGLFPYGNFNKLVRPPDDVPPWDILSPELQDLFIRCFVYGHSDVKMRPLAREWVTVIDKSRKNLKKCDKNLKHTYLNPLTRCPWCEIKENYYPDTKKNSTQVNWNTPPNTIIKPVTPKSIPTIKNPPTKVKSGINKGFFATKCSETTNYTQILTFIQIMYTTLVIFAFFTNVNSVILIISLLVSVYYLYKKNKRGLILWGGFCCFIFITIMYYELVEGFMGYTYYYRIFIIFYLLWIILTLRIFSYEKGGWKWN